MKTNEELLNVLSADKFTSLLRKRDCVVYEILQEIDLKLEEHLTFCDFPFEESYRIFFDIATPKTLAFNWDWTTSTIPIEIVKALYEAVGWGFYYTVNFTYTTISITFSLPKSFFEKVVETK
jgi:hypothetical protein